MTELMTEFRYIVNGTGEKAQKLLDYINKNLIKKMRGEMDILVSTLVNHLEILIDAVQRESDNETIDTFVNGDYFQKYLEAVDYVIEDYNKLNRFIKSDEVLGQYKISVGNGVIWSDLGSTYNLLIEKARDKFDAVLTTLPDGMVYTSSKVVEDLLRVILSLRQKQNLRIGWDTIKSAESTIDSAAAVALIRDEFKDIIQDADAVEAFMAAIQKQQTVLIEEFSEQVATLIVEKKTKSDELELEIEELTNQDIIKNEKRMNDLNAELTLHRQDTPNDIDNLVDKFSAHVSDKQALSARIEELEIGREAASKEIRDQVHMISGVNQSLLINIDATRDDLEKSVAEGIAEAKKDLSGLSEDRTRELNGKIDAVALRFKQSVNAVDQQVNDNDQKISNVDQKYKQEIMNLVARLTTEELKTVKMETDMTQKINEQNNVSSALEKAVNLLTGGLATLAASDASKTDVNDLKKVETRMQELLTRTTNELTKKTASIEVALARATQHTAGISTSTPRATGDREQFPPPGECDRWGSGGGWRAERGVP